MYEEFLKKYMCLAGTRQIHGGYRRSSFFHAVICLLHVHCCTHLTVFKVYTSCICPFLVFMCSNTNRLSFLANQPILCSTYVFETFLCLLLSFFVVDFVCRFNLLNFEFCVKAFLKRLSIYFP